MERGAPRRGLLHPRHVLPHDDAAVTERRVRAARARPHVGDVGRRDDLHRTASSRTKTSARTEAALLPPPQHPAARRALERAAGRSDASRAAATTAIRLCEGARRFGNLPTTTRARARGLVAALLPSGETARRVRLAGRTAARRPLGRRRRSRAAPRPRSPRRTPPRRAGAARPRRLRPRRRRVAALRRLARRGRPRGTAPPAAARRRRRARRRPRRPPRPRRRRRAPNDESSARPRKPFSWYAGPPARVSDPSPA